MTAQTTDTLVRSLRSDAELNRQRILDAAREVFLESGLQTPVRTIARRAGVGTATLYRRFPTRQDLLAAVFGEEVDACIDLVIQAADDPDPWRGFTSVIEELLGLDTDNRGFIRAFLVSQPHPSMVGDGPRRAEEAFAQVVRRAKDIGALRMDFTRFDLDLVLRANGGFDGQDSSTRLVASRRFTELILDAFADPGPRQSRISAGHGG